MNLSFLADITIKAGAIQALGKKAGSLGLKKPLLVSDPGLTGLGLTDKIRNILNQAFGETPVFDQCVENPREPEVAQGAKIYKEAGCDGLVALGGGSVMDVAKGIRVVTRHGGSILDYDVARGGIKKIGRDLPPMIAVPTTAGSGSEATLGSIIIDPERHVKILIFSPFLASSCAVLDPELTLSLPAGLTAATGMDALIHAIEAHTVKGYNPVVKGLCRTSIELAAKSLKKAVLHGDDLAARTDMMICSLLAGLAFANAGLGAVHAAAHQLSSRFGVAHGLANSIMLPAVMRFNAVEVGDQYLDISRRLGCPADTAEQAATALMEFARDLGLPTRLSQVGVTEDLFEQMAGDALEDVSLRPNPVTVAREDFVRFYREMM